MRSFEDLNEYVIMNIFDYCSEDDLENLYLVCQKFRQIIESRIYLRRSIDLVMSGYCKLNEERNFRKLTNRDRIRISRNWKQGRYKEYFLFHHPKWYKCKVALESKQLYLSYRGQIRAYKRSKSEVVSRKNWLEISDPKGEDISDFIKKGDSLFAGRINGSCFIYENDYLTEQSLHEMNEYLTGVDFQNQIYVTTSDNTTKLWNRCCELGLVYLELSKDYEEPFKCVKISNDGEKIACGRYIDCGRRALREIDIETSYKRILGSNSASVYNLLYKTDQTILTANYDTSVRLFDKRTDKDEIVWSDPIDSSVYCLDYDGLYGIVCGMQHHCRVTLYDIRVPKRHCQMYFPALRKTRGSPAYSIACDSQYLCIVTDSDLRILDFKADWAESKDFSSLFTSA